jgi:hypothetical protein
METQDWQTVLEDKHSTEHLTKSSKYRKLLVTADTHQTIRRMMQTLNEAKPD